MDYQSLVAFSESLHTLAASNQDLFEREIEQFKRLNGIDQPQQLAQACQTLQDQNRLMNIGIVGRVKAGKSSLLNALIFNGEPILPNTLFNPEKLLLLQIIAALTEMVYPIIND